MDEKLSDITILLSTTLTKHLIFSLNFRPNFATECLSSHWLWVTM
jgi:hypothetical protein